MDTPTRSGRRTLEKDVDSEGDLNKVMQSMSEMKLRRREGSVDEQDDEEGQRFQFSPLASKRTVEGSPMNIQPNGKKMDLNRTPVRFLDCMETEANIGSVFTSSSTATAMTTSSSSSTSNVGRVLVLSSSNNEHDTGNHQENKLRTELLCGPEGCLRREALTAHIEWSNVSADIIKPSPIVDLLRVHEPSYIHYLKEKCRMQNTGDNRDRQPFFYAPDGYLDVDTPLSPQSLDASSKFCRAAIIAVDAVMKESNDSQDGGRKVVKRSFVIGRPPGHHAGPSGCVPSKYFWHRSEMTSSGFCLLNTVAVAAAYARYTYGRDNESFKVAIVDIDIHHGNGTEEIVRNLLPRETFLPLPSSWAPVSKSTYKPWLNEDDNKHVFFASINLVADSRFYPCSGEDSVELCAEIDHSRSAENSYEVNGGAEGNNIINIGLTPIGPGPWDLKGRSKLSINQKEDYCSQASMEMRTKVEKSLLPALRNFKPDLLLISAGFDAHYDDMYHFLNEEDYHWITEQLCNIPGPDGRDVKVVSVLEGGYSLSSPLPKERQDKETKLKSAYGKEYPGSVAKRDKEIERQRRGTKFMQQPGDGGLVKGVLAHMAALAGKSEWKSDEN